MYHALAKVYDALTDDIDYDAWAAIYARMLSRAPGKSLAECACGTGNMTLRFAQMGYRVTASDLSPDMLEVAAGKLRAAGKRVVFTQQDMRELTLHKQVDAIACVNDGVNYLTTPEDVVRFFKRAFTWLKPGGCLAFDLSSRYKLEHVLANDFFGEERADVAYLWNNAYDAQSFRVTMRLTFFLRESGGMYRRYEEKHVQRAHDLAEIQAWLSKTGFVYITMSGANLDALPHENDLRYYISALKPTE